MAGPQPEMTKDTTREASLIYEQMARRMTERDASKRSMIVVVVVDGGGSSGDNGKATMIYISKTRSL
ncbi:unnamed protein product [Soboliphyme baturini]|uniref:VWFA domain-containing protein n=1 Tax=Soboliphyme baturini TaxID=241478 RepID=A0A183IVG4_9BILA|nr:unnamed protein product [Soboliphyme baturini]